VKTKLTVRISATCNLTNIKKLPHRNIHSLILLYTIKVPQHETPAKKLHHHTAQV
jgi:hypothetical protein